MNIPADVKLQAILAAIPDPHGLKGRRHLLGAMLLSLLWCSLPEPKMLIELASSVSFLMDPVKTELP